MSELVGEELFYQGHNGDWVQSYLARPLGTGKAPAMVFLHGAVSGWDEWTKEAARRFAHHGYVAIAPNLHFRDAPRGTAPDDAAAMARSKGGVPDERCLGDVQGALDYLGAQSYGTGKVGVMGVCSGGRQSYLIACKLKVDAAVDCWGGGVTARPERPDAPLSLTKDIACPILGLFGNDDQSPSPKDVDDTEAELKRLGTGYEFHRYDGAGHMFMAWTRPSYRQEQSEDAWKHVFVFLSKHLT